MRSQDNTDSIAHLDAFLNRRVLNAAATAAEAAYWWKVKVDAKRALADLPDHAVDSGAARILQQLLTRAA